MKLEKKKNVRKTFKIIKKKKKICFNCFVVHDELIITIVKKKKNREIC